ncbi:MAG: hypothetical protein R3281_16635 [Balneolaceae bacterium]|nr:hypothetical protein [Balneolaceae bacterium]
MSKLNINILKKMIRAVKNTRDVEIGCDECFDKLDDFIEMELRGKSPEKALPLVKDHLDRCSECREEYKVLLEALDNLQVYG